MQAPEPLVGAADGRTPINEKTALDKNKNAYERNRSISSETYYEMARSASEERKKKKKSIEPKEDAVARASQSPHSSSPHLLNRYIVGGQLLGCRPIAAIARSNITSWDTFEPIITPEISFQQRKKNERFILLPHARYITVLAYKTGIKVATLTPYLEKESDESVLIECVSVVKYQRKIAETTVQDVFDKMEAEDEGVMNMNGVTESVDETLVMVGCQDGSIREFSLQELGNRGGNAKKLDFGAFKVLGPCYRPRRVIRFFKKDAIMHMTVPHLSTQVRDDGILLYIGTRRLERQEKENKESKVTKQKYAKNSSFAVQVMRVLLPHFDGSITDIRLSPEAMRSLDKFKCKINKSKFGNTLPFRMLSVASPIRSGDITNLQNCSIFVVLARANAIVVYYDQLNSTEHFPAMSIPIPANNPLTTASISLNKADITCGHYRGNIRVMNNILTDIEHYQIARTNLKQRTGGSSSSSTSFTKSSNLLVDPLKNMITSRVHWHALPVASVVYDSRSYSMDPLLYSGGEESVLVTWQISQGRDRPVGVHPRLALGGIIHLSSSDRCDDNPTNGILVYCEDNTLQLLESHNKGCMWKIQGLASGLNNKNNIPLNGVSLRIDPRSDGQKNSQIVVTGLEYAPGYIHWFDSTRERVASSLEVVPFNRISRREPDERQLPKPNITGSVFSKNGGDLITIDESQTGNVHVGAHEELPKGDEYGLVSTIRFWSWNDSTASTQGESAAPYYQVASMAYPHGRKNRISAIDLSKDGALACTVSSNEKAFRVWQKSRTPDRTTVTGSVESFSWACRYKVKVPAGFSNFSTGKNGVTFSDDNSLLAIAFGQIGTIWDTEGAQLLTTFDHSLGNSDIELIQFVSPGLHQDLLLTQSKTCVSLRSPYGPYGNSNSFKSWSWSVPPSPRGSIITAVELIGSHESIAIAVYMPIQNQSRVLLTGVMGKGVTGGKESPINLIEEVDGCISALCAIGKQHLKSNWDNNSANNGEEKSPVSFYALTSIGDLILFTETERKSQGTITTLNERSISTGPRLHITSNENDRRKRQRTLSSSVVTSLSERFLKPKTLAIDVFGFGADYESTSYPLTAELPALSANFVKTFVGRNLYKHRGEQ